MRFQPGQQAYCQATGTSSTSNLIIQDRNPTSNDVTYPIGRFWLNTAAGTVWFLNSQSSSGGILESEWVELENDFGAAETLTGNSGGAVGPDINNNLNTIGSGSIVIVGDAPTNTLTTQLTGLTNHAVLVGANTTTITKVSPSATSGIPFVSQGAAADPAFSTAVVAGGGTGQTSLTNHGVLLGQATSPIVATSVGTNGQVLIGATGADPAFATLTSNAGTITFTLGANSLNLEAITTDENWVDQGTNTTLSANANYFATAAVTLTLPASPAQGSVISIIVDTASTVVIQANTGQSIRISSSVSSVAGSLTNTARGDALDLVYRTIGSVWITHSSMGNWSAA